MKVRAFSLFFVIATFYLIFPSATEAAATEAMINQMKAVHMQTCIRRTKVTRESLAKFRNEGEADVPEFKKYLVCMCKQLNMFKKGALLYSEIEKTAKSLLPAHLREATLESLKACSGVGGADGEEVVYNYTKCCFKTNKKSVLLV